MAKKEVKVKEELKNTIHAIMFMFFVVAMIMAILGYKVYTQEHTIDDLEYRLNSLKIRSTDADNVTAARLDKLENWGNVFTKSVVLSFNQVANVTRDLDARQQAIEIGLNKSQQVHK